VAEAPGGGPTAGKGCAVSDEDPWKNWYQADSGPGSDATQDVSFSSRMPSGAGRGSWPEQPPSSSGYGGASPGYGSGYGNAPAYDAPYGGSTTYGGRGGGRRWRFWGQPGRRGRRIALYAVILVLVIIVAIGGTYFWVNGKLNRTVSLPAFTGTSAGTNWLIVGDDSRDGVTRTEQDALHLGTQGANASDSLLLLHMGTGKPVLISIPRDSYVDIPGYGNNKINAALTIGGSALLVKTVESVTGLKINHYMGIGFEGLADVVNTVGGVQMCVKTAVPADPTGDSGFKGLAAGCHNLSGTQAIAFVRDRESFPDQDLQRIQDQRAFLASLMNKATSPGVYLNPFVAVPFASTSASSIDVDKGASLYDLLQAAQALRAPEAGTVPIANANYQTSAGDAVLWNRTQALELFNALQAGKAVPTGLLSGTQVG
jgi:LCP family protein required for cell wall assembly